MEGEPGAVEGLADVGWILVPGVEGGVEIARGEGCVECRFVDDFASCYVDQHGAGFEGFQLVAADKATRVFCEWTGDDQEVAFGVEARIFVRGALGEDFHAKGLGSCCDGFADGAVA